MNEKKRPVPSFPTAVKIVRKKMGRHMESTTTRRRFIAGALSGGAVAIAWYNQFIANFFKSELSKEKDEREERLIKYPNLRDIEFQFAEIFELREPLQHLSIGYPDDRLPTGYHPGNAAAGRAISGSLGLFEPRRQEAELVEQDSTDGDLILMGGPNSTRLTKIAFGFEGSGTHLSRNPSAIPLTYFGISHFQYLR